MKKKVISAILCGAMVLGTVSPVLAADDKKIGRASCRERV